jgi:hypothetical protein
VCRRLVAWLLALALAAAALPLAAQPRDVTLGAAGANLEYQVKAAFIFNFASFITWPARAFASTTSPLDICIVGPDPFGGALDQVVAGEHVGGHPFTVEHRSRPADLKGCQIVFVPATSQDGALVVKASADAPVLTIGETDEFWRDGGMITFELEGGHVRFDVNQEAAKHSGLELSSKLLRVARRVK